MVQNAVHVALLLEFRMRYTSLFSWSSWSSAKDGTAAAMTPAPEIFLDAFFGLPLSRTLKHWWICSAVGVHFMLTSRTSPGFSSILSTSPISFQVLAPMFQSVAWNVAFRSTAIFWRFCSFTLIVTGRPTIMGSGSTVIRLGSNPDVHGLAKKRSEEHTSEL